MSILDEMGITVLSDASALQPAQVATILDHPAVIAARARRKDPKAARPEPHSGPSDSIVAPGTANSNSISNSNFSGPVPVPAPASAPAPPSVHAPAPAPAPVKPVDPVEEEWKLSAARKPILLWGPPGSGKSTFLAAM